MAEQVNVAGAVQVKVGTGSASALESLGWSVNGIDISEDVFTGDVPGDQNGGDQGPPIEVQIFGEIHRIAIDLSKYDPAIAAKIQAKYKGGTAGTTATPGSLFFAGSTYYRVLLLGSNFTRNYPYCLVRQPMSINVGTKFSVQRIIFDAHSISNTLWNTTTTG
ncbi:MAG: hypothetical protein IT428_31505 [Planctomycetaceae bacterium]|nr:hypothetical protein [Planctomycetaceae bacterium]